MEKHDFSNHKFRASSFGDLMAGGKELTEKQKETIAIYSAKEELTTKQGETLADLIKKRDTVELSKGAKTKLREIRLDTKFDRRRQINSKYLTKGIDMEEEAIDWLSLYHGRFFTNNTERREDEYFTGECDILEGFDTKAAWTMATLPDREEPLKVIYEYQNRVYMRLWERDDWTTSAIAISMMEAHLKKELYGEAWKWVNNKETNGEIPDWRKIEIIKYYTYEEEYFHKMLNLNDCFPDLGEYKRLLEADEEVPVLLEKACKMFMRFIVIPIHERVVEKTVQFDKKIDKKMEKIAQLGREYMQSIEDEMYEKYLTSQKS